MIAFLLVALSGLAYWGVQLWISVRVIRSVPLLHRLPEGQRETWPRVSVIMTACDEEASLERAVRARLEEDYPALELVLVEDRSSDRTPEIARELAALDERLRVVHITELPPGWLGKLNAMREGLATATGEWLLFSDGDVLVRKGALRRVVHHCEERGLDHCVVLPRTLPVSPLLDCLTSLFMRLITLNMRIWAIEDPRSRTSAGAGAFNLVRRAALERTRGFEWLRMEVADDLALGQMLKEAGARQSVINGRGLAELRFHDSLGDSLRSAERASYTAIGNFSMLRLSALALATVALELSPLVALALASAPATWAVGAGLVLLALVTSLVNNRWWRRSSWNLVLFPLAALLVGYSLVRSGVLGKLRGGIVWRGTFYPEDQLKAGRRIHG